MSSSRSARSNLGQSCSSMSLTETVYLFDASFSTQNNLLRNLPLHDVPTAASGARPVLVTFALTVFLLSLPPPFILYSLVQKSGCFLGSNRRRCDGGFASRARGRSLVQGFLANRTSGVCFVRSDVCSCTPLTCSVVYLFVVAAVQSTVAENTVLDFHRSWDFNRALRKRRLVDPHC